MGFTLIELSIVLVIIGLIVGGVLVGQDLIKAGEIRATVAQYEKYNASVNTFRTKYDALPGDMFFADTTSFGLFSGSMDGAEARGDGDGLVESRAPTLANNQETTIFWRHLSDANLIEGNFGRTLQVFGVVQGASATGDEIATYVPRTKIARSSFFTVNSTAGINYYLISGLSSITNDGTTTYTLALTPIETYNIDNKVDDGLPNTGIATARSTATPFTSVADAQATWSASPTDECMTNGGAATRLTTTYNRNAATGGNIPACNLKLRFN